MSLFEREFVKQLQLEGTEVRIVSGSASRPVPHTCHATACTTEVPQELLMCKRHWRMVSGELKREVNAHYREGQCKNHKLVSKSYLKAARAAINFVAKKEGIA